jgi:hypothetical protein
MITSLNVHDVTSINIGQPETCIRTSGGTFCTRKIRIFAGHDGFVDITLFAADDDAKNLLTFDERAATPATTTPEAA